MYFVLPGITDKSSIPKMRNIVHMVKLIRLNGISLFLYLT